MAGCHFLSAKASHMSKPTSVGQEVSSLQVEGGVGGDVCWTRIRSTTKHIHTPSPLYSHTQDVCCHTRSGDLNTWHVTQVHTCRATFQCPVMVKSSPGVSKPRVISSSCIYLKCLSNLFKKISFWNRKSLVSTWLNLRNSVRKLQKNMYSRIRSK